MKVSQPEILVIIPARGGSKGIPRKNVRLLNGQPLISYAINNALNSKYNLDICVSTDDEEISRIAKLNGISIIERDNRLADDITTLDPVVFDAYLQMSRKNEKDYQLIITLQATSPLLSSKTLDSAILKMLQDKNIDTLISVVNDPHLAWTTKNDKIIPKYDMRVNRQYLPENLVETGAFLMTRSQSISENSRIGNVVSVFEIPEKEAVDIDDAKDWWIAETELSKKNILIRVEGYSDIGLGHVYRGLSLGYGLIQHNFHFVVSRKSDLAINKLEKSFFPYTVIDSDEEVIELIEKLNIDIIVNDILNTSYEYIKNLKNEKVKVINFEDLGDGAEVADAVINDLYGPTKTGNQYYWGSDYYIIRDEFINSPVIDVNPKVNNILVIFGGVDPNNLTQKVLNSLSYIETNPTVTFIVGPGYKYYSELKKQTKNSDRNIKVIQDVKSVSYHMEQADLAISSQGRTMLELAAMGVPTILMAQNNRELTHEFGHLTNGFINLGLGNQISEKSIASTINWLISTPQIRDQMHNQMIQHDLTKGLEKVLKIILN